AKDLTWKRGGSKPSVGWKEGRKDKNAGSWKQVMGRKESRDRVLCVCVCVCVCGCNSLLASLPYLGKNRTQELRGAVGENREAPWPRGSRIPSTFSIRFPHPHWSRKILYGGRALAHSPGQERMHFNDGAGAVMVPKAHPLKENS
ncbi:mCG145619, partial [Mus musculus]